MFDSSEGKIIFFHLTYAFSVPPTKVDAKQPAQAAAGEIVIGHQ